MKRIKQKLQDLSNSRHLPSLVQIILQGGEYKAVREESTLVLNCEIVSRSPIRGALIRKIVIFTCSPNPFPGGTNGYCDFCGRGFLHSGDIPTVIRPLRVMRQRAFHFVRIICPTAFCCY
ncbi:hypothetical protein NE237_004378 [Protea cynaroides]|uniref:Uncharacterized protein n=1 Tax=Protea cynaroides TaxID=273540 RepID=A0A9Q0QTM7_9MAGN|nr:hypothetical protein NE237_004378 [Protea cynaroides]